MVRPRIFPHRPKHPWCLWFFPLWFSLTACGAKQVKIPQDVESIARPCYVALATPERTPQLKPAKAMEDGTFLILWSMAEAEGEKGSCSVDGNGTLLLVTNNADVKPAPVEQAPAEKPTEEQAPAEKPPAEKPTEEAAPTE